MNTMRRRRAGGIAVLALCAGAVGALALPASGLGAVKALEDDRLVGEPIDEIGKRVGMVRSAGAKSSSVDIFWGEVAPSRPGGSRYNSRLARNPNWQGYNWERVDEIIYQMRAKRLTKPVVHIYDTPEWAAGGRLAPILRGTNQRQQYNPNAPTKARFFADFQYAAAKRYDGRTLVRRDGRPNFRFKVDYWEIWNEGNLKSFFRKGSRSNVKAYATLVNAAYPQIKRANRGARVIIGAAGPRSSTGNGNIGARQWMRSLTRMRNLKWTDYSQHIYCSQGPNRSARAAAQGRRVPFPCWGSIPEIHNTIRARKPNAKLYITEAGYTTKSTPFRRAKVSLATQAAYLRQIYRLPSVRSSRTAMVIWFQLQDNQFWPGGLLREDGSKKPSYRAFRAAR